MRYITFIISLLIAFIGHCSVNLDSLISVLVERQLTEYPNFPELVQKQSFPFSQFIQVNQVSDTIFVNESISADGCYGYISIWKRGRGINVCNINSDYEVIRPIHYDTEKKYIENWDTETLLKAGRSVNICTDDYIVERKGVGNVWTTRIIITNGQAKYETIHYLNPWFPDDHGYGKRSNK